MNFEELISQAKTAWDIRCEVEKAYLSGMSTQALGKWVSVEALKEWQGHWKDELFRLETGKKLAQKENVVVPYIDGCISLLKEVLGVSTSDEKTSKQLSDEKVRSCGEQ